jgi:enoyl-CoA hydratase/carnithine racemase
VFCAGGDVTLLAKAAAGGGLAELLATNAAAFADLVEAIVACPRPVVAAVGGPAVGGGVSLALACDVRIASPRASLVLGWGRWGLPPDGGASALLSAAVGPAAARALLVSSATIGANDPLAPLLFARVVPEERLDDEAVAVSADLAASPGARTAKAVVTASLLATLRAQREVELAALAQAAADTSVVEGLALLYKMK